MSGRAVAETLFYGVGDLAPDRDDPADCFALCADELRRADILFGQLEAVLTTGGTRLPQARHAIRAKPAVAPALKHAGFDVISFASNHCMDWGRESFAETIGYLEQAGVKVIGAGANLMAARKPAILEHGGNRVAVLAYCSILPQNYWAEDNRPGCAPLRAWTHYEQIEHDQPGTPCRVHTFAHREDLAGLLDDIKRAREEADVVIVSLHWGIHFVPAVIADYQREVAHAAIDAGADLILGHHAHILKGIEVYKGKAIFYSLCNFATDLRMDAAHAASKSFREIQTLNPQWIPNFDILYNCPPDSRMSVVAQARIAGGKIRDVSFLPVFINPMAQPAVLTADDPRFADVLRYLEDVSRTADIATDFKIQGDEVRVI